jgi:hypothetical protein
MIGAGAAYGSAGLQLSLLGQNFQPSTFGFGAIGGLLQIHQD